MAAEELYHVEMQGEASYVIEVETAEAPAEVEEVDFATIMASASVEDGAKVFRKCSACHKLVEGENVAGPYLYGVVGRDKAAAEGYGYSDALASMDGAWTPENLSGFLGKTLLLCAWDIHGLCRAAKGRRPGGRDRLSRQPRRLIRQTRKMSKPRATLPAAFSSVLLSWPG